MSYNTINPVAGFERAHAWLDSTRPVTLLSHYERKAA